MKPACKSPFKLTSTFGFRVTLDNGHEHFLLSAEFMTLKMTVLIPTRGMTLKLSGLMQMEFQVPTSKLLITGLHPALTTLFKCLNQPRQRAGDQGFVFRQRQQICTSRQALGPNETPINGHRGSFKRLKRPGIGVYHAYPSSVEVKNGGVIT